MAGYSNEFKVGLLTIVASVAWVVGHLATDDRPTGTKGGYDLFVTLPSAEGIFPSTEARIAGVAVGSVREIELKGSEAIVRVEFRGDVELPVDSSVDLKTEGVLGDRFLRVSPGHEATNLAEGDQLRVQPTGTDLEALQAKIEAIADDAKAITGAIRTLTEDQSTKDQVTTTVGNLEALSGELRTMTTANRDTLQAIAVNLRQLSETLNTMVEQTGSGIDAQMTAIGQATEKLNSALADVQSITSKIDQGEGTLGVLVNDRSTMDRVNTILDRTDSVMGEADGVLQTVTGTRTEVFYRGGYMFGSDPDSPGFTTNPSVGAAKNTLGIRLIPRETYWYEIELVDHPYGNITYEEHSFEGEVQQSYTEYIRTPDYRLSFQFARRWNNTVLRFGLKESSGGAGLDQYALGDRLQLSADLYDFSNASWPLLNGTPNLTLQTMVHPTEHIYLGGGLDNAIMGARYGYWTAFLGGGFRFTDDDLKWILAGLPFPG